MNNQSSYQDEGGGRLPLKDPGKIIWLAECTAAGIGLGENDFFY